MKKILAFLLLFSFCFLTGCSVSRLDYYLDNPKCLTTIEGNYYPYYELGVEYPCIFIKDELRPRLVKGKIMEIDSTGILFHQNNVGLKSFDPVFYPIDTLHGAVDSIGTLIYGDIPEYFLKNYVMHLDLEKIDQPDIYYLILELKPNQPFSYCIDPGDYRIRRIYWTSKQSDRVDGRDIPEIKFSVAANKANYLGDIFKNYKDESDDEAILIPFYSENSDEAFAIGFMFGLVGAAIYTAANYSSDADGFQVIHFEKNENFVPISSLEVNDMLINIKR